MEKISAQKIFFGLTIFVCLTFLQLKCGYWGHSSLRIPWAMWSVFIYYWFVDDVSFAFPWSLGLWQDMISLQPIYIHSLLYLLIVALMDAFDAGGKHKQLADGQQLLIALLIVGLGTLVDNLILLWFLGHFSGLMFLSEILLALIGMVLIYCAFVMRQQWGSPHKHFG